MVWLIAFLPAPTSQLLPAAAHNQFLNIHSARLDFAASVARVSAYTWQCQCQVDMSSRVISWAQIPGHVQWEIFGPTAWGEHCLSCPVVKYWVHLCSGKLKTASGHDNWQVASDIWHLTSGKLKTASGHYNWQVAYHTERQCSKPGLDTERLYWVCLRSSKSGKSGKSVLDTIIIISSPPLFWQIEDSACLPVVTSPPSKRGAAQYNNTKCGAIQQYTIHWQYNNTIRGTIQQSTHTIHNTFETICIQCGNTPGCRIMLNHTALSSQLCNRQFRGHYCANCKNCVQYYITLEKFVPYYIILSKLCSI